MAKTNDGQSGNGVMALAGRIMPVRRLGWSFLLAWVFCVFYTEVVDGYVGAEIKSNALDPAGLLFFSGFPVFMSVVMLVAIVIGERRLGSPASHPALLIVAPVATALSTPLLFWSTGDAVATTVFFVVGSVLTGFGSGFMWVMWGEYYAKISQEDAELLAPVSAVFSALLVLLVSAMSGWIALAFVTTLPLLSGACFFLSWKDVSARAATAEHMGPSEQSAYAMAHDQAKRGLAKVLGSMGRAGFGILIACLFVCLEGVFWGGSDKHGLPFQLVLIVSMVALVAVSFASTLGPRRISIAFLYRWMCPALVIGFVALILFGDGLGGYIAYLISIAARFAFCVITQMYFARYAATGKATAVQSYGLGWIFVHLGDFLGVALYVALTGSLETGTVDVIQISAVSIAVLVTATMFVLNDRRSFAEETPARKAPVETAAAEDAAEDAPVSADELTERIKALAVAHELTPRETEVFDLLARGRSVPYVRDALIISKETAATHAKHIYAKLGVHSRQELIDLVH